jgi:hypothetical protein
VPEAAAMTFPAPLSTAPATKILWSGEITG